MTHLGSESLSQLVSNLLSVSTTEDLSDLTHFCSSLDCHEVLDMTAGLNDIVLQLREYGSKRLSSWKSELGLGAVFRLCPQGASMILEDEVVHHPRFSSRLTVAGMYSLLKYGDPDAVVYFGELLAEDLERRLGRQSIESGLWGIVAPGYLNTESSAKLLAKYAADRLSLPFGEIKRADMNSVQYGTLGKVRDRSQVIGGGEYRYHGPSMKHVLLIDDAAVSGVSLRRFLDILSTCMQAVLPHVLIDVSGSDLTLEERLNGGLISPQKPDLLVDIINDPRTIFVVRTVKNFLQADPADIRRLMVRLDRKRMELLYAHALLNGLDKRSVEARGMGVIREELCIRGSEAVIERIESQYTS